MCSRVHISLDEVSQAQTIRSVTPPLGGAAGSVKVAVWIWFGSAHQTDAGEVAERDKVNRDNYVWKWECNYLYSYLYNSNIKLNILNTLKHPPLNPHSKCRRVSLCVCSQPRLLIWNMKSTCAQLSLGFHVHRNSKKVELVNAHICRSKVNNFSSYERKQERGGFLKWAETNF